MCLRDDRTPGLGFRWNSFTGDYVFVNPGPPSPPGGAVQPGGLNLTGIGRPQMKGCLITLSHNTPDRRVFARLDTCAKTGSGEVEQPKPKTTLDIKDGNTADSACNAPR